VAVIISPLTANFDLSDVVPQIIARPSDIPTSSS